MPGHRGTEREGSQELRPRLSGRTPRLPTPTPGPRWCGRIGPLCAAGGAGVQLERFAGAEGACPDSSSPAPRW